MGSTTRFNTTGLLPLGLSLIRVYVARDLKFKVLQTEFVSGYYGREIYHV